MTGWKRYFFVGAALLVLALLTGCGQRVELMSAIAEPEANEIMAALQNAGVSVDKRPGKEGLVAVVIPADQVGRAVDLLREKGLPRERFAGMGQVFKKEGLISSPLEERARYLHALSQELGATLSQIDGVIFARVHVVLPERTLYGEAPIPSSAAIFIKHQDGYNLDTLQPLVRRLVTHSIPGLAPEKISVVFVGAQPSRVKEAADRAARGGTGLGLVVLALVLLLLASLAATAFLAWKYWWPSRHTGIRATGEG